MDRISKRAVVFAALAGIGCLWIAAFALESSRHLYAAMIGTGAGIGLYHASFGFTFGWRRFVRLERGRELRAQLFLIGLICLVSYPLIVWGQEIGVPARGYILPLGIASAIGAFVFGCGMQLGGGCASGTLYTAGGGSTRMVIVLMFFIAGSVWATYHWDFWASLPRTRSGYSVIREFGAIGGLALILALLAAICGYSVWRERRRYGGLEGGKETGGWLTGPWTIWAGAVALALVGILNFAVLGRPWGVTAGFATWGAQAADTLGADPLSWTYWSGWRKGQIDGGLISTLTNASNVGIALGALLAAGLAGKFAPIWRLSRRDVLTAIIGGLMMGYGARLAYGCNIGAYLGGLTSGSLHGVWWLIWGFLGSLAGIRVRAVLEMDPPVPAATQGA